MDKDVVLVPAVITSVVELGVVLSAEVWRSRSRQPRTVHCCLETNQHVAARRRTQRSWDFCTAVANSSRRRLSLT